MDSTGNWLSLKLSPPTSTATPANPSASPAHPRALMLSRSQINDSAAPNKGAVALMIDSSEALSCCAAYPHRNKGIAV